MKKREIEFLQEGLKVFLSFKDLDSISITTKSGQITVSRRTDEQNEVTVIGFKMDEENEESEDKEV